MKKLHEYLLEDYIYLLVEDEIDLACLELRSKLFFAKERIKTLEKNNEQDIWRYEYKINQACELLGASRE